MPARRARRPLASQEKHPVQPVTTSRLPVVRCHECGENVPYKPGKKTGQEALQEHYRKKGHA